MRKLGKPRKLFRMKVTLKNLLRLDFELWELFVPKAL